MSLKLAGLFFALLLGGQVQDYAIRLERPTTVGSRYRLSATGREVLRTKITAGDKTLHDSEEGFTFEFAADATVLEVTPKGRATRKSFTVISAKLTEGGVSKPILPAGAIVVALVQEGRLTFQSDGKTVEPQVAKALGSVITLPVSPADDDDIFGSRVRRKAGESWGVNLDAVMTLLKSIGGEARREDVTGSVMLEKVEGNHLFLRGSMRVGKVLMPLPVGFTAEAGELRVQFSGRFPTENSDGSVDEKQGFIFDVTGRRPPDGKNPELRLNLIFETGSAFQMTDLGRKP